MSTLNRASWISKVTDFINRVSPFTDPLIQKSEDLTLRQDLAESVLFRIATEASISNPAATFTADFTNGDQINVSTTGSIPTAFTITIAGLKTNEVGKLKITKKTNDTIAFANASMVPFNTTSKQTGVSIYFYVANIGGTYIAINSVDSWVINNLTTTDGTLPLSAAQGKVLKDLVDTKANSDQGAWTNIVLANGWAAISGATPQYRIDEFGIVHLRGQLDASSSSSQYITADGALPNAPGALPGAQFIVAYNKFGVSHGAVQIAVTSAGKLSLLDYATNIDLYLNGVSYATEPF